MIKRKHRQRLAKMRRDGYLKRDNPMTPPIKVILDEELDVKVPVLKPWADAWITMEATGSDSVASKRELPLYENMVPSDATAIYLLLGRYEDDEKVGNSNGVVLAHWVRLGLSARGADVALASDVSSRHANRVKAAWEDDLRALLSDAALIGLTGSELFEAVTNPSYFPEHVHRRLTALRAAREETLVPTPDEDIRNAWRSFRENASRQGMSSDHYEVDPPRWFVKSLM